MSSPAPEPTTGDTPHVGAVVEVGSLTALGRRDARPQTGALEALLAPRDGDDEGTVRVVDTAEQRVRHPIDLVNLVLCAIGVAVVLLMSVYAHGTTAGVAEDVRNFSDLLARILFVPVAVLEGLITLFVPIAVLTELGVRRLGRQVVESIVAAGLGLLLGVLVVLALGAWGSDELVRGLSVYSQGAWRLTVPGYVAAIGGLLTAAGTRTRRRTVKWSWNLLFVGIGVVLITGQVSLPGILITLLLGRLAGLAVRYVSGVRSERAYGPDLVAGVRRAGFSPVALVRVRDVTDDDELAEAADDPITEVDAEGRITAEVHVGVLRAPGADDDGGTVLTADAALAAHHLGAAHPDEGAAPQGTDAAPEPQDAPSDPAAIALTRAGDNRVYAMLAEDDVRRDVVVLDGDRQVVGFLTRFWRSLRLRGSEGRAAISLRAAAERTALLSYAARAAGVRTPRLLGVAESADSMVLVQEHATGAVSLRDLPVEDLTGSVLNEAWRQLRLAHSAGIAHRALTSDVVLVSHEPATGAPEVWLTGWEQGDIASSELARRMDLAQMVALLALRVGAQRAVESAVSVLPDDDIAAIGPLLQSVALPPSTREEIRQDKELLKELRAALVERLPEADVEPQRITRFGGRTILTLVLVIAAVTALVTSFNFDQIATAVTEANPWFAVLSFALGILTWVGAALTLAAFSPKRLSMWRVTLTQAAGSYIALAAPAGIGPAALNLRLLTKRGTLDAHGGRHRRARPGVAVRRDDPHPRGPVRLHRRGRPRPAPLDDGAARHRRRRARRARDAARAGGADLGARQDPADGPAGLAAALGDAGPARPPRARVRGQHRHDARLRARLRRRARGVRAGARPRRRRGHLPGGQRGRRGRPDAGRPRRDRARPHRRPHRSPGAARHRDVGRDAVPRRDVLGAHPHRLVRHALPAEEGRPRAARPAPSRSAHRVGGRRRPGDVRPGTARAAPDRLAARTRRPHRSRACRRRPTR